MNEFTNNFKRVKAKITKCPACNGGEVTKMPQPNAGVFLSCLFCNGSTKAVKITTIEYITIDDKEAENE